MKCNRGNWKPGWKCITGPHDSNNEPCGLVPRWWNFRERLRVRAWNRYYRKFEGGER